MAPHRGDVGRDERRARGPRARALRRRAARGGGRARRRRPGPAEAAGGATRRRPAGYEPLGRCTGALCEEGLQLGGFCCSGGVYTGRYLNGTLDEVRVWTRARTAEELRATMHTPLQAQDEVSYSCTTRSTRRGWRWARTSSSRARSSGTQFSATRWAAGGRRGPSPARRSRAPPVAARRPASPSSASRANSCRSRGFARHAARHAARRRRRLVRRVVRDHARRPHRKRARPVRGGAPLAADAALHGGRASRLDDGTATARCEPRRAGGAGRVRDHVETKYSA